MKQTIYSFFLVLVLLPFTASAQYAFKSAGIVNSVDFKADKIIIGDIPYKLGQTVTIYDQKSSIISQSKVKQGVKIGVTPSSTIATGSNVQTIYEIWVLPSNFDLSKIPNPMALRLFQ